MLKIKHKGIEKGKKWSLSSVWGWDSCYFLKYFSIENVLK
jgi:hypothetical protein